MSTPTRLLGEARQLQHQLVTRGRRWECDRTDCDGLQWRNRNPYGLVWLGNDAPTNPTRRSQRSPATAIKAINAVSQK